MGGPRGSSRRCMGGEGRARRSTGLRSSRRSEPRKKGPCTSGEEAAPEKSSRCGASSSRSSQEAAASNEELPSVRSALPLMHGRLTGTPGKAARLRYSSVTKLLFDALSNRRNDDNDGARRDGAERGDGAGRRTTTGAKALYFGSHESLSRILARVEPLTWLPDVERNVRESALRTHEPHLHVTLYQKPSLSPRDTERRRAGTQNR